MCADLASRRLQYELLAKDEGTAARRGRVTTKHGVIETPVFMPVGTVGTLKGILNRDLLEMKAQIILGNTYHLWLRPGLEVLAAQGGLRQWMGWEGPLLTDSGGFQVFSLAKLRKITPEGVEFRSHLCGKKLFMSPETSIDIQECIASTIMMVLDVCPALPASDEQLMEAVEQSSLWAERCLRHRAPEAGALFAIAQGGLNPEIRREHIQTLAEMTAEDKTGLRHEFDGMALGGFSVGEAMEDMYQVLPEIVPSMPEDKPRYLMGVGSPRDLLEAVAAGLDMFDCVMPTRNARNGYLFTSNGVVRIHNAQYKNDSRPLDPNCTCYTCQKHSLSYLRHLFNARQLTASVLASIHNLHYYQEFMGRVRAAIEAKEFKNFYQECLSRWA